MRKIWSLYVNEIIKTKKRISIIIIMCIMVALVFAFGGLFKLTGTISTAYTTYNVNSGEQLTAMLDSSIDETTSAIESYNQQLLVTTDEAEKASIQYQIDYSTAELNYYNLAKANNLDVYSGTDYLVNSAVSMLSGESAIIANQYGYATYTEEDILFLETMIDKYTQVIEDKDYSLYLDVQRDIIDYDVALTDEEKQMQLELIDLMESSNPTGEESSNLDYQIQQLMIAKQNLFNGVNSSGALLSDEEKSELEDSIKVTEYEIENGYGTSEDSTIAGTAISAMISIGVSVIAILVIIIAGGSVSSELSSGTIKSLIISPTRRWKIFTAKFLSITSVGLICSILTLIAAIISYLVFFGAGEMSPYVYASGGTVHAIPFVIYQFLYTILNFVDVFVFMVFAFMLSIITRNTAASVGVSLGVYFAGGTIFSIIATFFNSRWMDFIPFNNMEIADRVFTNSAATDMVSQAGMSGALDKGVSVGFSAVYLLVLVICMLWIGFDSFTRKDI